MWLWGILLVVAASVLILVRYLQRRDDVALLEAAMLLSFAFFILATRMHERYVYNAFVLMFPLAPLARRYLWASIGISFTLLANLWYSLYYANAMEQKLPVNGTDIFPWMTHPLSALNVLMFFALGYIYLGGRVEQPAPVAKKASFPRLPEMADGLRGFLGRVWFAPSQGLTWR